MISVFFYSLCEEQAGHRSQRCLGLSYLECIFLSVLTRVASVNICLHTVTGFICARKHLLSKR